MLPALLLALATTATAVPTGTTFTKRQDNTLWLSVVDSLYTLPITVGTPPQTLNVALTAADSDLWLRSGAFDSNKSTSFNAHGSVTAQAPQLGELEGKNATDIVILANNSDSQEFGYISSNVSGTSVMGNTDVSGVLGLGTSPQMAPSAWSKVLGGQTNKEFGVYLGAGNGEVMLGGPDTSKYPGASLTYVPVVNASRLAPAQNPTTHWVLPLSSFSVAGRSTDLADHIALIDPGYTGIVGEPGAVATFYENIHGAKEAHDGSGAYTVPCDDLDIAFSLGGVSYTVSTDDFVTNRNGVCYGALMASTVNLTASMGPRAWVLGSPFLRSVYASYKAGADGTAESIGLAPMVNGSSGGGGGPNTTASAQNAKVSGAAAGVGNSAVVGVVAVLGAVSVIAAW